MRLGSGPALIAGALFTCACGSGQKNEKTNSRTQQATDAIAADEAAIGNTPLGENDRASLTQVKQLFKNEADFKPDDLKNGFIACAGLERLNSSAGATIVWKSPMRDYLAKELLKFPDHRLLFSSVSGIYLTKSEHLQYNRKKGRVGGITCQNSASGKSIIFLNEEEFVSSPKMSIRIGQWYETENLVHNSVVEHHGDQTLYTLIHELFHAIDLVHFIGSPEPTRRADRQKVTDLSWNGLVDPKYERIGATALTLTAAGYLLSPASLRKVFTYSIHQDDKAGFALASDTNTNGETITEAKRQVSDYKSLAEKTNFLTPYSTSNAIEDFADTLAAYYFGTRYNSWMMRSIYDLDLTTSPVADAVLLHTFDTGHIIRQSAKHKSKACMMAKLVFSESCEPYLKPPKLSN